MRTARIILAILLALFTVLALYVALTVPMIASTGPIIFALACGAVTWFVYPRRDHGDHHQGTTQLRR